MESKKKIEEEEEEEEEESYTAGLKENVIARNVTLGDIHNQFYFFIVCYMRYIMFTLIKI